MDNNISIEKSRWNIPVILQTNPTSIKEKVSTYMFKHLVDFCCITESWCPDKIPVEKIDIGIYIHLLGEIYKVKQEEEAQHICTTLFHKRGLMNYTILNLKHFGQYNPFLMGSVYHPPKTDDYIMVDQYWNYSPWRLQPPT